MTVLTDLVAPTPLAPRPQQVDALADLTRAFAVHDRAQLVMACGTGKTLVGRWHAQAVEAQRTLVFVPSLSLLAQTLGEWRRATGWPFEALVVCSDPTTSAGAAERRSDEGTIVDVERPYWSRARAKVTTSAVEAAEFLTRKVEGRPQVVFSTYHSAPVVAAALADSRAAFDLAIYDEAHRLAGRPREEFRVALDRRAVQVRKRLFMTATPHFAEGDDVVSMDDAATFGPVAHTVTFGEAIDAGLLSDYQVLVIADREGERHRNADVPSSLLDAVRNHDIRRMLTFHSRVARAAAFAETMDMVHADSHRLVRARHVSSKQTAGERAEALHWLGAAHPREVRVVANARCLTEGIDVPAVDAVMFADQRSSVIDIIQAVGRVLRPSPGKTRGSIIIPVMLPADGDDDTALALSKFGHVWAVLRGLRAHDQRLAEELDRAVREGVRRQRRPRATDRIQFVLPDGVDRATVQLRLVQEVGSAWERFYAATLDWATTTAGDRLPRNLSHRGIGIGNWAASQRVARTRGMLTADRVRRLEEVPGWYWERAEADFADTYQRMESYAAAYDTIADKPDGESRFAGVLSCGGNVWRLGVWMAYQRQLHRDGMLDEQRARMLEKLPGWAWDAGLREQDVAMVQALRLFVEFEKHADVPEDHVEDGLPVGRWVWAVRRAHLLDRVPPALVDELVAACPRDYKGASLWRWEKVETQWRLAYSALRQYVGREQVLPTGRIVETIDGSPVGLGQWAARQRFLHRRGELEEKYTGWLEAVPGWQWEVALGSGEYGEPVDLGGFPHGTPKGTAAGCKCQVCVEARRARDRDWLARRRQLAAPVPGGRAARRIAQLEEAGAKRGAIAAVSQVPLGVLRKVASGEWTHLERDHEARLRATTVEQCRAAASTRLGSRGRSAMADHDRVPAGPTRQILDDLEARGFGGTWVARELGYARGLQLGRDVVSRRIAEQIAELAGRVGDLSYPRTRRNQKSPPPLADLLAAERREVAA